MVDLLKDWTLGHDGGHLDGVRGADPTFRAPVSGLPLAHW